MSPASPDHPVPDMSDSRRPATSWSPPGLDLAAEEAALLGHDGRPACGLALSGGGIRAASFSLGVAQAYAGRRGMETLDYLSTVSGGGYTGAALSWLAHLGFRGQGFVQALDRLADRLRSRGNYLDPGQRLTAFSLLAVVLRTMLVHLFFYMGLLLLAFLLMTLPGVYPLLFDRHGLLWAAAGLGGWFLLEILLFLRGAHGIENTVEAVNRRYRRRTRSQQRIGVLLQVTVAVLGVAALPFLSAKLSAWVSSGGIAVAAGVALRAFLKGDFGKEGGGGLLASTPVLVGAAALLVAGMAVVTFIAALRLQALLGGDWRVLSAVIAGLVLALACGWLINLNLVSLGRMYRDRLMEAFMPDRAALDPATAAGEAGWTPLARQANCAGLAQMRDNPRPLHLINTALVLVDATDAKLRGRGACNFVLSPWRCGSDVTGWVDAEAFCGIGPDALSLATAMATSGAAVNPYGGPAGQGPTRSTPVAVLMGLLGLQLGLWVRARYGAGQPDPVPNIWRPGLSALFGAAYRVSAPFRQLADGGHFENLGVYELIRRRVKTLYVVDAAADPEYRFADLGVAVERVYADFGAVIRFEDAALKALIPQGDTGFLTRQAAAGWAEGTVTYADGSTGTIVYFKTTLIGGLPVSVNAYAAQNPAFPQQSTADQFFDEDQLEAYRALGYAIADSYFGR